MSLTALAAMIEPALWGQYIIVETYAKSAFRDSGVAGPDPRLAAVLRGSAQAATINLPNFDDLSDAVGSSVSTDTADISLDGITTHQDVAPMLQRDKAWGSTDLAAEVSGADVMGAIGSRVGAWWARDNQRTLLAALKGVFADNLANDDGDHVVDVSVNAAGDVTDANLWYPELLITAADRLGDAQDEFAAIAVHSTILTRMKQQQLIEYVQPAGTVGRPIPMYGPMRVIVDDSMPRVGITGAGYKFTSYLFAPNSVAMEDAPRKNPIEVEREALVNGGQDALVTRRAQIIHPRGCKWLAASVAGQTPTNAELEAAANWDRVRPSKDLKIVQIVTNG